MIKAAGFVCLLALPLAAQEEIYRDLELGNRVKITFRSGGTISGTLVVEAKDPRKKETVEKVDYLKAEALTLDIKWEYPGSEGTVTIPKDQIVAIRKLAKLDKATIEKMRKDRERIRKQAMKDEAERQAASAKRAEEALKAAAEAAKSEASKDELERLEKELAELKEGQNLLNQFPTPAWGPERLKKINQKGVIGVPLTSEEQEFVLNYDKWAAAYNRREEEKKKAEDQKNKENEESSPKE